MRRNQPLRLIDAVLALLVTAGAYACTGTWSPEPGIQVQFTLESAQVGVGRTAHITLSTSDEDTFTPDGGTGYPVASQGPYLYHWSAAAGSFDRNDWTGDGSTWFDWTAPQAPGLYTLTLTVNDAAGDQGPPGTSIDGATVDTLVVEVMPRIWDPCPDLWGSASAADDKVQVDHEITLTAHCDGDTDNWTSGPEYYRSYGNGEDTVTYTWQAPPSGYYVGDIHSPTITWHAGTEASEGVTLTCRIDDEAVVPEGDEGNRDDAYYDATCTVAVWKIDSLKVRRHNSGNEFASTCIVAAGGKSTDEHKADVEIRVWPAVEGVTVPAPTIVGTQRDGEVVDADLGMGAMETDWEGRVQADATYRSSDVSQAVAVEVETGAGTATATIQQVWHNAGSPWDRGVYYFTYGEELPVTFTPRFNDPQHSPPSAVPITTHEINFLVVSAVGWHWNGSTYVADYEYDGDAAGVIPNPNDPETPLAEFRPDNPRPDSGGGVHHANLFVTFSLDDIIDSLTFWGQDNGTYHQ